ncbi:MAG: beta-glucosidase BglX [Acidobacteriota bacterium]|nr:beta-glucosidase BglX [Acidobacteriota bacterium]
MRERVEAILEKMTLAEKIGQMTQIADCQGTIPDDLKQKLRDGRVGSMLNVTNPEISREIQRIAVEESRLGIPLVMARDVIHGFRTIFPIPLAQAATWNPELARECARVAAKEASAAGFQWTFAPMMDIARDPRWGRIAESFGEDPYLASLFAAAIVRGFQGDSLAAPDSIAACAKHFVGYGAAEGGRDYDTANIPEGLLRDVYLAPFRAAVDAGAATLMTAFNEIDGVPATANKKILQEILRGEWLFDGLVVSDWRSVAELVDHGFCEDLKEAARKALCAGVDMEMQSTAFSDHLESLILEGTVPVALVDRAVRRILEFKCRLGLFEKKRWSAAKSPARPGRAEVDLAKKAAMQSIVLLKNNHGLLPLSKKLRSIAVIGPLADDPYEVLGTWNRDGCPEDTVTPLAAIRSFLGESVAIHYEAGLEHSRSQDTRLFESALDCARRSDVVLFFAGEEAILSGEAHSRAHLDLPGAQDALIAAVAGTGTPVVLIILAGRPLTIGGISERVDAVLYAWHPGTLCGAALADLIFGVESPSGKLPVTFPRTEGQIPVYYAHKNTGRSPDKIALTMMEDIPVRAYQSSLGDAARYLDIGYLPLYPFGYGLSYVEFSYGNLALSSDKIRLGDPFDISVEVTNTGARAAEEVVQVYIRDVAASRTRPVKELKGFRRIHLNAGEAKTVTFTISTSALGFHGEGMKYVVEPGTFLLYVGGDSRTDLKTEFQVI